MKKLLFIIPMLAASVFANAQSGTTTLGNPTNESAVANSTSLGGWFEVTATVSGRVEHYTVNYGLFSKPFVDKVLLSMNTANPLSLRAEIVDAYGTRKATWGPQNIGYRYDYTFDISTFAAGKYYLNIYDNNGNKVNTTPFDKTAN